MIVREERRSPAPDNDEGPSPELLEFIRYCYRRRRVKWPSIYDDMCAVAARGEFNGWGLAELAQRGIGFTIAELPRLAGFVDQVIEEEERRERGTPAEPHRAAVAS